MFFIQNIGKISYIYIYIHTHTVAEARDCQGLQPRQEIFFPNLFLEFLTPFRIIFFNLVSLDIFFFIYIYIYIYIYISCSWNAIISNNLKIQMKNLKSTWKFFKKSFWVYTNFWYRKDKYHLGRTPFFHEFSLWVHEFITRGALEGLADVIFPKS